MHLEILQAIRLAFKEDGHATNRPLRMKFAESLEVSAAWRSNQRG
jgi:hypothetical protein